MKGILAGFFSLVLLTFSLADNLFDWQQPKNKSLPNNYLSASKIYQAGKSFSIDTTALKLLKVNDQLTINLPNNEIYLATINKVKTKKNNLVHLLANIQTKSENFPVVITIGENQFFMRIVTSSLVFVAQGVNNNGYLVDEAKLKPSSVPLKNDVKTPPSRIQLNKSHPNKTSQTNRLNESSLHTNNKNTLNHQLINKAINTDEIANIDVLFVYSNSAADLYGGDITTRLSHIIEVTNQIYVDSEVNIQIRIANTVAVDYPDDVMSEDALDAITFNSDKAFESIDVQRFESGADMVVLLRPYVNGDNACGIAWGNHSILDSIEYMYSHTSIDCGDYVNAHELGHNMGLAHSRAQEEVGYTFPYAIGYRIEEALNGFSTVMAYEASNADKVYKFSNPNVLCSELACGVDHTDPENGADASYALNQVRFQLQSIMDEEPDLTLASDALDNITDNKLKNCLNNQITNYSITYASQVREIYCNYLNITSLEGIGSFKGLTNIYLSDNAISDLSPLSTLTQLTTLTLRNNNISDITPLAGTVNLSYLVLDNNNISNIDALANLSFITTLWIGGNKIHDISALEKLFILNALNISSNNISSLSSLINLTQLKILYANDNKIQNLEPLVNLTNLNLLEVVKNEIIDITPLAKLTTLQNLTLAENKIIDITALSQLNSLEYINIDNNQLTSIPSLTSLTKLSKLHIINNNLSNINSVASLGNLNTLWLDSNNIVDISALSQLTNLTNLQLGQNPIIDITPLSAMKSLIQLKLDGTSITNIEALAPLANLLSLTINNTSINNIETVSLLYKLNSIVMSNTNIADISPLFSLHNAWSYLDFTQSNKIYCWQLNYIDHFISSQNTNKPTSCDTSQDLGDADGDGATNQFELANNTNPLYHNQKAGTLEFQLSQASVNESSSELFLKVIRKVGNMGEVRVDVTSLNGTAVEGDDFNAFSQILSLADGELFGVVMVSIIDDKHFDANETFNLELSNEQGATLGENTSVTITITDNDSVTLGWPSNYHETTEDAGLISFTINRPTTSSGVMSVDIEAKNNTALNGTDFNFATTTVSFSEQEYSKDISVDIVDNDIFNESKSFYLKMSNPNNAVLDESTNSLLINILENEVPPSGTISFDKSSYSANESDGSLAIHLVRENGSYGEIIIDYAVTNDSAISGEDFTLSSGQLIWLDSEVEKTISITIINDTNDEDNESFSLTLSAENKDLIGALSETTITIIDNDDPVIVTPPTVPPTTENKSSGGGSFDYLALFILLIMIRNKKRNF